MILCEVVYGFTKTVSVYFKFPNSTFFTVNFLNMYWLLFCLSSRSAVLSPNTLLLVLHGYVIVMARHKGCLTISLENLAT